MSLHAAHELSYFFVILPAVLSRNKPAPGKDKAPLSMRIF